MQAFSKVARAVLLTIVSGVISTAGFADVLIDNFEGRSSPAPWTFSKGPEFPGATGALTLSTGYSGQGAHLAYDFSHGGNYVGAFLSLPTPLAAAAVSFWVKSPANIRIRLRVTDSSGQTLQYNLSRPLGMGTSGWYQQLVLLDGPSSWWGGANNGAVQGPIKTIGILAGDAPERGPAGAIIFDDVYALSSTTFKLDRPLPLIAAPPGSGDLLSRMSVNIHFTNDDRALDAAKAAGFAGVRMDLSWSKVETSPNVYDWSVYDGLISALQSRGMKALLILDYGNILYTGGSRTPPTTPGAVRAFGNFAQAAANHFAGKGVRFEVWNEPNWNPPNKVGFWPPAPNAAQYAALAAEAIHRVHQGDPKAIVTTAGLSGFDYEFARGYLSQGGGKGADAIGVHPYDVRTPPGTLVDNLLLFRSIVSQYLSPAPPVVDTEWGFSSTDFSSSGNGADPKARQRQAMLVARELLSICAAGAPFYVYYDLRDDAANNKPYDPTNREDNFGLLANDYTDKPAMTAVKTLAAIARGRTFTGLVPTSASTLVAMRFDGPADQVFALWSIAPNSRVVVEVPSNATVTDFLGNLLTIANGTITVSEVNGPIYILDPK